MPPTLDASAVRAWCRLGLRALGAAREEIDAINVFPVADGDTGTNLYLTVESAAQAVDAAFDGHAAGPGADGTRPTLAEALSAMAHGALIGARGNSGTILAQLLRGMSQTVPEEPALGESRGGSALAPGARAVQAVRDDGVVGAGRVVGADGAEGGSDGLGAGAWPGAGSGSHGGLDAVDVGEGAGETAGALGDAALLRRALRAAAESAYAAVSRPVEGTMLSVATGAADAAGQAAGGLAEVVRAAHAGALAALARTPGQLPVLRGAGVVDAGGLGLTTVLAALCEALTGRPPLTAPPQAVRGSATAARSARLPPAGPGADPGSVDGMSPVDGVRPAGAVEGADLLHAARAADAPLVVAAPLADDALAPGGECAGHAAGGEGPAFEVIYLLEAADETAVARLRARLDALGDSLVVVGGDGLWHVHVHVDDAGAAIEAGIEAGRPYRIRVTHFADQIRAPRRAPAHRAVVALVQGDGLAGLCAEAGATVVAVRPGEPPAGGEIAAAIRRAHAREVVVLPNDAELRPAAGAAAESARADGVRVALIPTRSPVQGLAALAVHQPSRRFDEDVVAMTTAAGATRYAELTVAERESWTMAGVCQAGDVLGLIDGDVAVIGADLVATAAAVLDRMLAAGGELVTLVLGASAPPDLGARIEAHVRDRHLAVDTVSYAGGRTAVPLLIGVE